MFIKKISNFNCRFKGEALQETYRETFWGYEREGVGIEIHILCDVYPVSQLSPVSNFPPVSYLPVNVKHA